MVSQVEIIRHSISHILAEAITKLYPGTKLGIGPAIENGFYYDFLLPATITESDFPQIEKEMRRIIASGVDFKCMEITREKACEVFSDQPYKLELIKNLEEEHVIVYEQDGFRDLCRGPHVENSGKIRPDAFKLRSVAGAYWRGDEKREMLTRIYGLAFEKKADLDAHLKMLEEAEKRDNRRLGKELDLFSIHEDAGPGLIYWHPRAGRFRTQLEKWWQEEHYRNGYEILYTPHLGKSWLWETSGHLGFYKENMYAPMEIDENDYYIKPMNCPFHILVYKTAMRSYRELPLRWAELGTVYRYERSGVLHGLLRVRGFTQDDAHIICTPEQIEDEIAEVLRFSLFMWRTLGFNEIRAYLATKPKESIGDDSKWEKALESLRKAVTRENLPYEMDEGGGAFYGPKIDLKIKDAIGREWQMTTIQFDFNLPERFDMTYISPDGEKKRPFMVHRALLGSLERFFGIFLENCAGAFPLWLSPEQVVVIPVAPVFDDYAKEINKQLISAGLRSNADLSEARMNAKIRNAQNLKTPYMLIVGQNELDKNTVSARCRNGKQENDIQLEDFIKTTLAKIKEKVLDV